MATAPLSVAGVSGVLKRGGCERSTSTPTATRGFRRTTCGYKVKKPNNGNALAIVEYVPQTYGEDAGSAEIYRAQYAQVLTEAGYRVIRTDWSGLPVPTAPFLSVFAPEVQRD